MALTPAEKWSAVGSFALYAAACALALTAPQQLREPDDWSYRAQLEAHRQGHLTLDADAFRALELQLRAEGGAANQWVKLPDGRYLSEKNPGYALLVTPFYLLGLIRIGHLLALALACAALWLAGRQAAGAPGAFAAVGCFLASPALEVMAARPYMPTLTECSLAAAALALYSWAAAATSASERRQRLAGAAAFFLAGLAVPVRFTSAITLALMAVHAVAAWAFARRWKLRTLVTFAAAGALPLMLLALYDVAVFGGPLRHAYGYGERGIDFTLATLSKTAASGFARELWALPVLVAVGVAVLWRIAARLSDRPLEGDGLASLHLAVVAAYWAAWAAFGWTGLAMLTHPMVTVRPLIPAAGAAALVSSAVLAGVSRVPVRWLAALGAVAVLAAVTLPAQREALARGTHFVPGPSRAPPARSGACPPGLNCPFGLGQ